MKRDYLQEALHTFNGGNWYGWKTHDDNGNKIPNDQRMQYQYIKIIKDGATMPTEAEVNAKIQELKDLDSNNENPKGYVSQRRNAYPEIGDQLDMLWHTMDRDNELQHKFYDFYQTIKKVKVAFPKK